ncbi:MAG: hypothetical protein EOO88_34800 [Pedobacter sp.]|nr:MAG: hypothetical protein EOO88_34800 [Pedobacter sp.]
MQARLKSNRDEEVNKLLGGSEGWHVVAITPSKDGPVYSLGRYAKAPSGETGEFTRMADYDPFAGKR